MWERARIAGAMALVCACAGAALAAAAIAAVLGAARRRV